MSRPIVFNPPDVKIKAVHGKGRGVFATRSYEQGELIESCPVMIFTQEDADHLEHTPLWYYLFDWDADEGTMAMLFGYGMLYNHSYQPNARMVHDHDHERTDVFAEHDIEAGAEILLNYLGEPDATGELWFDMA